MKTLDQHCVTLLRRDCFRGTVQVTGAVRSVERNQRWQISGQLTFVKLWSPVRHNCDTTQLW